MIIPLAREGSKTQFLLSPLPGPLPVCISVKSLDQWCHHNCCPLSTYSSRQKKSRSWTSVLHL